LLLELADIVANRDKHVAMGRKFGLVADRIAVARDVDRPASHGSDIRLGRLDHPVDVSTGVSEA
jgi:hypothetical protein